jgi:hypothetical protein
LILSFIDNGSLSTSQCLNQLVQLIRHLRCAEAESSPMVKCKVNEARFSIVEPLAALS